ncbi:hypothetical protein BH09PSE6_BH09PSE6_04300 [soil metagenome]
MKIEKDSSGRRSVELELEVPGTPEEVWRAIATGPGISSWFVPTTVECDDRAPVAVTSTFGPGLQVRSDVTQWNPTRQFAVQGQSWGGAPPIAIEWNIEARSGDVCVVRVVNSLFASTDEWDDQLEGAASAWLGFFRTLSIYLTHFPGQRSALLQFVVPVPGSEAQAWDTLTAALGVEGLLVGDAWAAPAGAPALKGVAEYMSRDPYDALIRLDEPAAGVAALGAFELGGQSMVAFNLYQYGDLAQVRAEQLTPAWQAWIDQRFPAQQP